MFPREHLPRKCCLRVPEAAGQKTGCSGKEDRGALALLGDAYAGCAVKETILNLGTSLLIALQRIFGHRYRLRRRREVGFQLEVGPFEYVFEYAVSLVDRD